ncbi:MAG: hypothetical protein KHX14_00350 [[Clostridium] spiroforme]|uniref:Uncharacterized protein n=1 Tax=Thomasclavelia spiroformis TaxID=29348 RepID=A0A943I368_9FIRM|nr:hypothetical protein [Thomasclavelia spiroformis]
MVAVIRVKRIFIIMLCLLITGCKSDSNEMGDKLNLQYQKYIQKLIEQQEFNNKSDEFSIRLVLNKINDTETRYDIIIDSPKINMYALQAIAKVENDDESSLPSLGILEEESFSLVPGVVDKTRGIYRGVNLSGVTREKNINVIIYLRFYSDENNEKLEERFIRLDDDAT